MIRPSDAADHGLDSRRQPRLRAAPSRWGGNGSWPRCALPQALLRRGFFLEHPLEGCWILLEAGQLGLAGRFGSGCHACTIRTMNPHVGEITSNESIRERAACCDRAQPPPRRASIAVLVRRLCELRRSLGSRNQRLISRAVSEPLLSRQPARATIGRECIGRSSGRPTLEQPGAWVGGASPEQEGLGSRIVLGWNRRTVAGPGVVFSPCSSLHRRAAAA